MGDPKPRRTSLEPTQSVSTRNRSRSHAGHRRRTGSAAAEGFWATVRNEVTVDRLVINLNNGHVSPAPRTVQEAMRRYLGYSNMGPYHTMIRQLAPKVEMARRMIAETAGCDPEEIAMTRNSSEALEIAQLGVKLNPGDQVVTANKEVCTNNHP